ncbi:TonB-dependent receptor [Pelomonas sp. KK5]|uniref:TonB-dependent receptor n=1 Tax=Pelomonas sp. KK5 TaxID=1855730 RepID=UPI00097C2976|nr:TonB-dependent receptor [Pelomonas sp. KK5]
MKNRPVAIACRTLCTGLLLAATLAAQAEDATSSLDTVSVIGKRARQARDIAGGVSAVTGEQLEAAGAQDLADYIQREPGVVFNSYQPGVSHVVLRGIATSSGNVQGQTTTGYFLNEVPLTEPGWTIVVPDIDTFDLARVEVLRGPQGTLFGSGAMGGAIQYVANVADARGFDAAAETTISSTKNASVGYTGKAMVNVPIKENLLAVRAVAEYRRDPGYLDNIGTGEKGSNTTVLSGGRFSAVLTPSRGTTLTWLSLVQKTDSDDNAYRMQGLGELERKTSIDEPTKTRVSVHSLRLDQDLGGTKFTALAATQTKKQDWVFDFTPLRSAYNSDLQLNLTNPLYIADGGRSRSNSLELRLASASGGALEWLIGAMTFDTDKDLYEQLGAKGAAAAFDASPAYGAGSGAVIAPDGSVFNAFYTKVKGRESALFGEATYALAPQWKLTAGGRFFHTKVDMTATQVGFSTYPGSPIVTPSTVSESGFNPKLSLAWQASPDLMVYALASEGFRFGTPNTPGLSSYPIPAGSKSDSLRNYELGLRSRWAGGQVLLDATLFRIDWSDIQLRLQTPDFFNYAANGGKARSTGLEMSFQWKPSATIDWQTSLTWQHARLADDLFILWAGTAPKGSQLPGTADWSISNRVSYNFGGAHAPTLSLSHQFLSGGISDLNSAVPGAVANRQGNYKLFDARLRMNVGEKTELALFCTNLTDKRGITRTVAEANGTGEGLVRPRTFGATASWHY